MPISKSLISAGLFGLHAEILYEFQPKPFLNLFERFILAVIDDDIPGVDNILSNPANLKLLIREGKKNQFIESQFTGQKFLIENENALSIAVKLKKIGRPNRPGLIEILISYFDRLKNNLEEEIQNLDSMIQTDVLIRKKIILTRDKVKLIQIKEHALACWKDYEYQEVRADVNEIIIPEKYSTILQSLINIFIQEEFANHTGPNISNYTKLSAHTEAELSKLVAKLTPDEAIKIDDHLDIELLLYTAYKAYADNFNTFQNWPQRDGFCIRVIGLIQRSLLPEVAKVFCQGLHKVVENKHRIGHQAETLKLRHWSGRLIDYYRPLGPDGLGCEYYGGVWGLCLGASGARARHRYQSSFKKFLLNKSESFTELYYEPSNHPSLSILSK